MKCVSCGVEISYLFKHAIQKNECPACGDSVLDEEMLVLIENIKTTILEQAKLREETVHRVALALLTQYSISFNDEMHVSTAPKSVEQPKIAPPSSMRQVTQKEQQDVITAEEMMPEGVSDSERERIMEDVVRKRYAVVDQIQSATIADGGTDNAGVSSESVFTEGDINPILEQERIARLAKQKQAMDGGGAGSFRRSG